MATAWYECGFDISDGLFPNSHRTPQIDRYTPQIKADGGDWAGIESGATVDHPEGAYLCKVAATNQTINAIRQDPLFTQLNSVAQARNRLSTTRKKPSYDDVSQTIVFTEDDVPIPVEDFLAIDAQIQDL